MKSYKPEELFDKNGKFIDVTGGSLARWKSRRMGGNPM